jgi:ribosomal protein S18 acetylase RimI-like enzyme
MKIRNAETGDAGVLADFNSRIALETENWKLEPSTIAAGVKAVLADKSKGIYFVAEAPTGEVIGQLLITYEWSDWRNGNIWWIQSVYVQAEFRGQGVFQKLFRHVEELARKSPEVCRLRLYVEKHNDRARRAYQKLGMNETGYDVLEFDVTK